MMIITVMMMVMIMIMMIIDTGTLEDVENFIKRASV